MMVPTGCRACLTVYGLGDQVCCCRRGSSDARPSLSASLARISCVVDASVGHGSQERRKERERQRAPKTTTRTTLMMIGGVEQHELLPLQVVGQEQGCSLSSSRALATRSGVSKIKESK